MSEITLKSASPVAYDVDGWRIDLVNARVTRDGAPVPLTMKAFDTLVALVEQAGRLVTKDELLQRVWPGLVVDENNLTQQISTLRKALGAEADWIETVPRRGYRFVGTVRPVSDLNADGQAAPAPPSPPLPGAPSSSPASPWPMTLVAGSLIIAVAGALGGMWLVRDRQGGRSPTDRAAAAIERAAEFRRAGNADGTVAELQEAIRLDPANPRTYGELAHALNAQSRGVSSAAVRPRGGSPSVEAARRGVELDRNCGVCLGTLGLFVFYHDWQFTEGERLLRDAIRLAPNSPGIRPSLAMLLAVTGRPNEAVTEVDRALAVEPYQITWLGLRASSLYYARRYEEAIAATDRILAIKAAERGAWDFRSKALFQLGRGREALHALAQEMFAPQSAELDRAVQEGGVEGGLRALLQFTDDWRGRIEQSWRRAAWRALLGEAEGAIDELENAFETRRLNAINFGADPVFDKIRAHPRFTKLLEAIGLAPYFSGDAVLVSAR